VLDQARGAVQALHMTIGADVARFELLAAVAKVADGSLSLGETVERLLDVVVPAFADVAALDAVGEGGELRHLGVRVEAAGADALERALLTRRRRSDAPIGMPGVIARGESQLLSPVGDGQLRAMAADEADLDVLRSLRLRSALYVALRTRGRTLGVLACAVGASGREYAEEDVRFAEVLAGRAALALDNAGLSETVTGLEQRLEATLANLAEAVLVRDPTGQLVYANPAAARLLGVASVSEVTGAPRGSLAARFDMFDERGVPLTMEDLPATRAQRGEPADPVLVRNVVRATGLERWLVNKATPVFASDGSLTLIVSVIEDVTEVKRAELAQRLLSEAGKALSSSLDYQQTLRRVAELAVPELADWCGVTLRGEGDVLEQVAVAHADPRKVDMARALGERYPTRIDAPIGIGEVIRTGVARLMPELTTELLERSGIADEQKELVAELQIRSVILVPLVVPGRPPFGALSLVSAESGRVFDADDLALAEELGRRAATAVENARLYTERSRVAATLQQSLLPPRLPEIPSFRLASMYRAAGEHSEVGGDFYDAFEVPGGWIVLVGDVAGRGADAAALTSLSRYTLRTAGRLLGDPLAALRQLNAALRERPQLSLVSVCCTLLRDDMATVILAGHPPAYLIHGGEPRAVGRFGPLLGAYEEPEWTPADVALGEGDRLVLYTDGVTDTVGESDRFGEERLSDTLRGMSGATNVVRAIERALTCFAHGPQADDTAVLVVDR
jgi:PAS domain S-box-containing protein